MERIISIDKKDIINFYKALEYSNNLLFGSNYKNYQEEMEKCFFELANNIVFYDRDFKNMYRGFNTTNLYFNYDKDKDSFSYLYNYSIFLYTNSIYKDYYQFLHTICHEIWHSYITILGDKRFNFNKDTNILKGRIGSSFVDIKCNNINYDTGLVEGEIYSHYGTAFVEGVVDLLAYSSIIVNDQSFKKRNITLDKFLTSNEKSMRSIFNTKNKYGYFILLPVIKLMVNAFSNLEVNGYQRIIDKGESIINYTYLAPDNINIVANEFLYGYVYNPLIVQKVYDTFMGENKFYQLCIKLDKVMDYWLINKKIYFDELKDICFEITDFFYERMRYIESSGILTKEQILLRKMEYSNMLDSATYEYSSKFSKILTR